MAIHDAATLRGFQGDGESRLVFARATDRSVVWMPDGEAEQFRAAARGGELKCIVDDCVNPRLKAVNRGDRRHGFAHHAGAGGHAAMGIHHLQGQLLIARWLRESYPDGTVVMEETTEDGRRRADVMFTSASGRRAAFEIQYAALDPRAWRERHDSYAELGILDVWLWGHTLPQLRRDRGSDDRIALNPTHEAVATAGMPLLWINPELGHVGIATTIRTSVYVGQFEALAKQRNGTFEAHHMNAFRLTARDGFSSDRINELRNTETAAQNTIDARQIEEREEARREELRRANTRQFIERITAKARANEVRWKHSKARNLVLEDFGGRWPEFLDVAVVVASTAGRRALQQPYDSKQWQGELYVKFLRDAPAGAVVPVQLCSAALQRMDSDVRYADQAVTGWFEALAKRGVLRREKFSSPGGRMSMRFVIGDLNARILAGRGETDRQRGKALADKRSRDVAAHEFDRRERRLSAYFRDDPFLVSVDELREAGFSFPATSMLGRSRCVLCKGTVNDQPSLRLGYHTRCAPDLEAKIGFPLRR